MTGIVDQIRSKVKSVDIGETFPAVCISGGIDSTVILHHVVEDLMNGAGSSVHTFTATFGNDKDERNKAKRVADYYGTIHTEVEVGREELLQKLPFILKHYPFPRFNVWPWIVIESVSSKNLPNLFIGEGSDELFGYPDRSFLEGWAGQLVWVWPAWSIPCNVFGIKLHAPFMEVQEDNNPVTQFLKPPDKELLRDAYKSILPDFVVKQVSTPPSHGFYASTSKEELQLESVKAWLQTRDEIHI
jgi:hypothetical protein